MAPASDSPSRNVGETPQVDEVPVRERLVRSAIDLLADAGPGELKVRTITERAGVSTITVYHHFGGLHELLSEVVTRGYDDLRVALVAASEADPNPGVQLFAMALSAREVAQRNVHLYDIMFGLSTRGTHRHAAASEHGAAQGFQPAYEVLATACATLARSGGIPSLDGDRIAAELWSLVHGFVTLEIAGHFARFADPVSMVLRPMAVTHFVGMGFDRDLSERGAARAVKWFAHR